MTGWIVIPKWDEFQHYRDRDPIWIKVYTRLLSDPDFLGLTMPQRGLLLTIWLEYARSNAQCKRDVIRKRVGESFRNASMEALIQAGFIEISASRPLARRYQHASPEKRREEPPKPPNGGPVENLTQKDLRRFTGCRHTRGSHGAGYTYHPLGVDPPPKDWPHEKPTRRDVELALKAEAHA